MKRLNLPRWAWWLLLGGGIAALLVANSAGNEWGQPEKPQARRAAQKESRPAPAPREKQRTAAPARLELERLTPAAGDKPAAEVTNVFGATSWYVPPPPPPPPPPAPPPKPTAPAMPFVYLGSYDGEAKPIIFLAKGDRVYSVSPGDIIEGTYRVDGLKGSVLEMTYLPLKIKQTIETGGV